jgi:heme-degrading monooxygenase HmoA
MFMVISQFVVAPGQADVVREAFRARPHLVDRAPGFIRMDVVNPREEPDAFWLVTLWQDECSYRAWHHSHAYHDSHAGIPAGLKLVSSRTRITYFDHVTS